MSQMIIRDPFAEFRSLMRFATVDPFAAPWPIGVRRYFSQARNGAGHTAPLQLDVYKSDDGLAVEAPLPGFSANEVTVTLDKGRLSIRAERAVETNGGKDDAGQDSSNGDANAPAYVLRERRTGALVRALDIGDSYDAASVQGTLKDGLLTLTIKKRPEAQPKRIEIQSA